MKSEYFRNVRNSIFLQLSGFIILMAIVIAPFGVHAITYSPGETLNPLCGPTDPDCGVTPLGPAFTTPVTVTNGTVTSSLRADGLYIATSTSNLSGLFFVDSSGNVSASGTLQIFGNTNLSGLSFTAASGTSVTSTNLFISRSYTQSAPVNPVIVGGIASSVEPSINGAWAIEVRGKYAYVGTTRTGDENFNIIDISDPHNPTIVGTLLGEGSSGNRMNDIRDVSISGNYAYVLSSYSSVAEANLHVIDISDPTNPTIISTFTISTSTTVAADESIEVVGNYAYITNTSLDSLLVVNITNPKNPTIVGAVASSTVLNYARGIVISGKYAYISSASTPALGGSSLVIADISNPYNPVITGSLSVSSTATSSIWSFAVSGKYAYLGDASIDSVYIVDISSSTNPLLVGTVTDSVNLDSVYGVTVAGKYVYAAVRTDDSLRIIDISSSTNPILVGGVKDSTRLDGVLDVEVSGKYAYVAGTLSGGGFHVIDIGGIDAPVANIGALQVNMINVTDNLSVGNSAHIANALNVGAGGIMTNGGIALGGTLSQSVLVNPTIVGSVVSSTALNDAVTVHVSGKYAYVVGESGTAFNIIDISNPTTPTIVGTLVSSTVLNGAYSVYVSGKYAYVANNIDDSLRIIDISDPTTPTIVGGIKSTALNGAFEVYVSGKYAYVANIVDDSLRIVDISNPKSPTIVGGVVSSTVLNGARGVYVSGKYAYVTNVNNAIDSLSIIDVSNPREPVIVGGVSSSTLLSDPDRVYVSGRYAYVAANLSDAVTIIDIASSTAPTIVGWVTSTLLDSISSLYVSGKYAYTANSVDDSLRIIDISNPSSPVIVGGVVSSTLLDGANSVFVQGKYAYVASDNGDSLAVIDIGGIDAPSANIGALQVSTLNVIENFRVSNDAYVTNGLVVGSGGIKTDGGISLANTFLQTPPVNPVIVGSVVSSTALGDPRSLFVSGKYAYVVNYGGGSLRIIDITNPTNSQIVGGISDGNLIGADSIYVAGKYAYVTSNFNSSLSIVDVSNSASPVLVGNITSSTALQGAYSVYVAGKYAYVANYTDDSLRIVDISSSTAPTIVGGLDTNDGLLNGAISVYVSGRYAYVAASDDNSLRVIDISNPTSPTIVGGIKDDTNLIGISSVYVSGRYAYVANITDDSMRIIDISSSTAPTIVGGVKDSINLDGAISVYVSGKYAYVASVIDESLRIIDISSSTAPVMVGGVKNNSLLGPYSVYVQGKYAYTADSNKSSMSIIDIGGIDAPSANIGSLQSSNISVTDNLSVGNNAYITNGLNVGSGGIMTDGGLSAAGTTTLSGLVVSSSLVYMPGLTAPGATSDYLCFDTGGKITHQAGNCTVSSERFKHDIETWNEGLATILELRPVTYKRNHDDVEELGLIAEEVDLINKHLVIYEPSSTTPRSVDYARLVIPLISAVQSQQQQIDGLLLATAGVNSSTPRTLSEEELLYAANRPLASAMTYLLNRLSDGATILKDFLVERVTAVVGVFEAVKTNRLEVDGGIQMKDKSTGEVYCVVIDSGEITKISGNCTDSENVESDPLSGSVQDESGAGEEESLEIEEELPVSSIENNDEVSNEDVEEAVVDILSDLFAEDSGSTTSSLVEAESVDPTVE